MSTFAWLVLAPLFVAAEVFSNDVSKARSSGTVEGRSVAGGPKPQGCHGCPSFVPTAFPFAVVLTVYVDPWLLNVNGATVMLPVMMGLVAVGKAIVDWTFIPRPDAK
jgi:hypothetical protein